jgi:ribonuclease HII
MTKGPLPRHLPLGSIDQYLRGLDEEALARAIGSLSRDPRAGARALAARWKRRRAAAEAEDQRTRDMFKFELSLMSQGFACIAGADEVGRGCLAGPLVAAAVVLRPEHPILGVKDSKLLDSARREELAEQIRAEAVAWAVAEVTAAEIDRHGIQLANMMALRRAVEALGVTCDYVLTDGFTINGMEVPSLGLVRGDRRSASVAAASIVAKVARDRMMAEVAAVFPGYGFEEHVGYGTAGHVAALRRLGPCPIHRRSFAPVSAAEQDPLGLE